MIKKIEDIIEKRTARIAICVVMFVIMSIQFSSSVLYSLDDYYLEDMYVLNWSTIGYNWYGYGRLGEALLGQIIFLLNLSPFNGIGAFLIWGLAVSFFADYVVKRWGVKENVTKILCMLVIVFNPFFMELYFYKNILIFSAISLFAIRQGLVFMDSFWLTKRAKYLMASLTFVLFSLSIYQIFFPIIFMIYAVALLIEINRSENTKSTIFSFLMMVIFLIVYYVLLKIMFVCKPSTIVYPGSDIKQLFRNVILNENDFWGWVVKYAQTFLFSDNMVSSGLINKTVLIIFNVGLICYLIREIIKNKKIVRTFVNFICVIIVELLGLLSCFGFSLTSIFDTSSRSFTGWGVYLAGLLCIISEYLGRYDGVKLFDGYKKLILCTMMVIVFSNACRINRCSADIYKMNQNEAYLINRVVARLEEFDSFDPSCVRIYVYGYADLPAGYSRRLECLNKPVVGGFSTVAAFRLISGYNFQAFNYDAYGRAVENAQTMPKWPAEDSIMETTDGFIIKLGY